MSGLRTLLVSLARAMLAVVIVPGAIFMPFLAILLDIRQSLLNQEARAIK